MEKSGKVPKSSGTKDRKTCDFGSHEIGVLTLVWLFGFGLVGYRHLFSRGRVVEYGGVRLLIYHLRSFQGTRL